jgi:hypothetical protein
MVQDIGEIIIKKEKGQGCDKCETMSWKCKPNFTQEATDYAMNVVIEKIERTMYGIEATNKPGWVPRYSGAQGKRPHDSSRLVHTSYE